MKLVPKQHPTRLPPVTRSTRRMSTPSSSAVCCGWKVRQLTRPSFIADICRLPYTPCTERNRSLRRCFQRDTLMYETDMHVIHAGVGHRGIASKATPGCDVYLCFDMREFASDPNPMVCFNPFIKIVCWIIKDGNKYVLLPFISGKKYDLLPSVCWFGKDGKKYDLLPTVCTGMSKAGLN